MMKNFASMTVAIAAAILCGTCAFAEDSSTAAGTSQAADAQAMNKAASSPGQAGTAATAQQGGNTDAAAATVSGATSGMQRTMTGGASDDASAAGGATSGTATGKQGPDHKFVEKATIGGLFEVQSSQLAAQKAQNDQVKQFAQQMVTDHTAANQELTAAAQQKQIQQPSALDQKHADLLKKLEGASGEEFDKEYSKAQLGAHKEAVQLFEKASSSAQDPDLKAWAAKTLPKLKEHLDMAKQLPANAGSSGKEEKKGNE
jgi:putative membrane protein